MKRFSEGLCLNCVYSSSCSFQKGESQGVQFCEEYGTAYAQGENRVSFAPAVSSGFSSEILSGTPGRKFLGLCDNCDHRYQCSFPKPESGVWHCEEYE